MAAAPGWSAARSAPKDRPPLILSLERMAAIRAVDPVGNVAVVEAGVVLADLQAAAEAVGRVFPLTLAAQGIGAHWRRARPPTRAGSMCCATASARDLCLGLEAVLADGTVLDGSETAAQGQHRL